MVPHTAVNAAFTSQHTGCFPGKFPAFKNWLAVISSVLWPKEGTERNQAFSIIILKGILNFGAVSNTSFEFLISL